MSPTTTKVIEVEGLRKRYGAVWAVDGVSFAVDDGEIFGILGSNGAGKTTAIECLQGLRVPDAGRLRVLGRDPLADDGSLRRLVGSQLQDAALPERIRVQEAIELFADAGAVDTDEIMQTWGLAPHRKQAFASLVGRTAPASLHRAGALEPTPGRVLRRVDPGSRSLGAP